MATVEIRFFPSPRAMYSLSCGLWSLYLVSLVVSWLDRDFLKGLEPLSPHPCNGALCAHWGCLQLCLSLPLLFAQNLNKVSQRWDHRASLGQSRGCIESRASEQPYTCAWLSSFPRIYWRFSKPLWTSHSPAFPCKLFS